jgi:hypothetical protein
MCQEESARLQRGMNFRLRANLSVILMSLRRGAPYADRIEDDGKTLIYEGHDVPRKTGGPNPKKVDQPRTLSSGKLTQNGLFFNAATGAGRSESVRVYEKIRNGVWVYAGLFDLLDAWQENSGRRESLQIQACSEC